MFAALPDRRLVLTPEIRAFLGFLPDSVNSFPSTRKCALALGVHRRHRAPVLDYQCAACGRVFNAYTGTSLQGTHRRPGELLLILHGVATGVPTARMARELGCDRGRLLGLRHRLQDHAFYRLERNPPGDPVVEADETYVNAGEKRRPA